MKILRSEIRKLSEIVDGWNTPEEITGIERDLALEKLRTLYDAVRFALPANDVQPAVEEPLPVSIDLDAAFSIDPLPAAESVPVSDAALVPEQEVHPAAGSDRAAEPEKQTEAESSGVAKGESETAAEPKDHSGIGDGSAAGPEERLSVATDAGDEPIHAAEQEERADAAAHQSESASEPAPASEPEPAPSVGATLQGAEEAAAGVFDAKAPAAANPSPQPVVPTLFGPEEAIVRHRHKQRVIMSLYGAEPQEHASEANRAGCSAAEPSVRAERAEPVTPAAATDVLRAEKPNAAEPADKGMREEPQAAEPQTAESQTAEPQTAGLQPAEPQGVELQTAEPQASARSGQTLPSAVGSSAPANDVEEVFVEETTVAAAVLGDVINHDVRTLGDTIIPRRDVASELGRSKSVGDLRSAIGINDRFLLIRDLFGGDAAAYETAIAALSGFDNLDDCMIHIAENYAWNPNSDGAQLLMELLERKYS